MGLLKDKPNLDHFRLRIEGDNSDSRGICWQFLKGSTRFTDKAGFKKKGCDGMFGEFRAAFMPTNNGFIVRDPEILINREDFRGKKKFIGLIQHHEVVEMLEVGLRMKDGKGFVEDEDGYVENSGCHGVALNKEFDYAFEQGIAEEYLKFLEGKAVEIEDIRMRKIFIRENNHAFKKAKRRFLQKKRG